MRHSLGRPLPYQLADTTQAAPEAINLYPLPLLDSRIFSFDTLKRKSGKGTISDYPVFRRAIRDFGVRSYVLLPRLPCHTS